MALHVLGLELGSAAHGAHHETLGARVSKVQAELKSRDGGSAQVACNTPLVAVRFFVVV
jgi:hypothetical protein